MGKNLLLTGIISVLIMFPVVFIKAVSAEIFTITGYCSCEKCCDKPPDDEWYGITATGTKARWGTIAVDRKIIKLGSKLRIEGFENIIFKAEDVGGAIKGKRIDIWFPDHRKALQFGKQKRRVWYNENNADVWLQHNTVKLLKTSLEKFIQSHFFVSIENLYNLVI